MFVPDSWQSHSEYVATFKNSKARFPSALRAELFHSYSDARAKLFSLNLDPIGEYVTQFYSPCGRPAMHQAQILRSFILLGLLFNQTPAKLSLTSWVKTLSESSVLAALIGCSSTAQLPPLGSYYDLMNRFWKGSRDNYGRNKLLPPGRNSSKPKKDIGADGKLVEQEPAKYSTREMVDKIVSGQQLSDNPEGILQDIFYLAAVLPSINKGLVSGHGSHTLSGDGTAVAVHSNPYGKRQIPCVNPSGCPYHDHCPKHYSDPDASWGWDSDNKTWYFGRTLYMICCRNNDHKIELPILMKYTSARRHDSISFLFAADELGRHEPGITPKNFCLDSAHDNIPTYELLERWDINALIDLNGRNSAPNDLPEGITLDSDGYPLCKAGFRMYHCGYDKVKHAIKYRCPYKCGKVCECPCAGECSDTSYGRTVYLKIGRNLRFHPRIPRGTDLYRSIYSERTACERVNDRVLNDYHLQEMMIRGDDHYSFWTMIIGICIHLDAWFKVGRL